MDTIFALSSGAPPAAIAIVRLSGPAAFTVVRALCGNLPPAREAGLRRLHDEEGYTLDRALVLVFPEPASATGEDVVELHLHGGRAVVAAIQGCLRRQGARDALPGEFTRRALENGRIDLAQAEGLADLLQAETEQQRRAAISASEGHLSRQVRTWMETLSALRASVEVAIDYADEGDEVITSSNHLLEGIAELHTALLQNLEAAAVEQLYAGFRVVVAGPPNTGKSTLINALCGRDVAIVSDIAGTTRDRIESNMQRDGRAYTLVDTAGLGEGTDPIEAIGMNLAQDAIATADLVIWTGDERISVTAPVLHVRTKADQPSDARLPVAQYDLAVSAFDPATVHELWSRLGQFDPACGDAAILFNMRQRSLLRDAASLLDMARETVDELLVAEHLRAAHHALSSIIGVDADGSMLDALFTRFCVGK